MTNTERSRLGLTFYRGITVEVAPHLHGNPMRRDPSPRYYRECGYRGIPEVPTTVQTSTPESRGREY